MSGFKGHLNVLENYDPTILNDPFHWIRKGLMEDLMDNGETFGSHVNDQVSGYTIPQLFNALQSDVFTIPQYQARLVQQNPGNPHKS